MAGIWGDRSIKILGVTGENGAGKSFFCASIDPKNTLYLDAEGSATDYVSLGFDHRDLHHIAAAKSTDIPKPIDIYHAFIENSRRVERGKYSVIVADPLSGLIEAGMVDWIAKQYGSYGFKSESSFRSTEGIFWQAVKSHWQSELMFLASKCETFAFIAHLRAVFRDGKPTHEREAAGKATLRQIANLYLHLERKAKHRTLPPPLIPSATVEKVRTLYPLPPRIPECTPDAIRKYLAKPIDYSALTEDEIPQEKLLTDDDKLRLSMITEEARRDAAAMELETVKAQTTFISTRDEARALARAAALAGTKGTTT